MILRRVPVAVPLLLLLPPAVLVPAQTARNPAPHHEVVGLPLDARPGSAEPRLAVAPGGQVVVSWLEPSAADATRLRVATLDPRRRVWAPPRTVAEGSQWFVNWADVPSVVPITDTRWLAHWLVRSDPAQRYAYDIHMAVSDDAGRTWGRTFSPHDDGTATEHGFVSMAAWPGPDAGAAVVWLDGRAMQSGAHAAGAHGDMSLRAVRVDPRGHLSDAHVIDDRVCECCPTSAVQAGNVLLVAYRNRTPGETRDIHVARLAEGRWESGRAVAADGWVITACPVNGPALAASGRDVALAWFTAADDQPRVRVALSADAGGTWGRVANVSDGNPLGRVGAAMLPDGSAVVSWIEAEDQGATIRLRRVTRDGASSRHVVVARVGQSRVSGYPRIALTGDHLVLAWVGTAGGETQVQTATLALAAVR